MEHYVTDDRYLRHWMYYESKPPPLSYCQRKEAELAEPHWVWDCLALLGWCGMTLAACAAYAMFAVWFLEGK